MTVEATAHTTPLGRLSEAGRFLRTSSLARSVLALLTGAMLLLLVANFSTFVMIRGTADVNRQVDDASAVRRAGRSVLLNIQSAETAQRGFLLTGQAELLRRYEEAAEAEADLIAALERQSAGDTAARENARILERLSRAKFEEMSRTIDLARTGRMDETMRIVRIGQGQAIMNEIEAELTRTDSQQGQKVRNLTAQSERSAAVAIIVNAVAGGLIVVLAAILVILVRRYLAEINTAREELDRVNAGLEDTISKRTAALTRANEEVQRFAYIVSHDLRSPLVNVMGYTSELEQASKVLDRQVGRVEAEAAQLVDPEAVLAVREDMPEAVGFIRASTEKMDRLINAILKLSRDGRRTLTPEVLDMTAIARRIADSVQHQVNAVGAEISVEPLPALESDRLSIEQIVGNLIDNATKYLDPSRLGRIVVTGREAPGGWVEYAIADNGRGISARDHERIFELFRRAGKQDQPGEGLGLAFVRNSTRRLGGTIDVESVLGEGSTFRLKFPKRLIVQEAGDL